MEKIFVISRDKRETQQKLKELFYMRGSEKRVAIHRPFTSADDPLQKKMIAESDMVVFVAETVWDMVKMLKGYPKDKYENTVCLLEKNNFFTGFWANFYLKNTILCPKGQCYKAIKGLTEMLTSDQVIKIGIVDVLECCKKWKDIEIHYFQSEKDLVHDDIATVMKNSSRKCGELLIHLMGDLSLSEVSDYLSEVQGNPNIIFGVGYKEVTDMVKTCMLLGKKRRR